MNKETEITCEQVLSGVRAISMDTPLLAASTALVREPPWPHLKMKGRTNGFMISSVLIDLLIDYDGLVVNLTYIRSSFVPQTNRTFKIKYIHAWKRASQRLVEVSG